MAASKNTVTSLGVALAVVSLLGLGGCEPGHHEEDRLVGAETIRIRLPERFGALERPVVEFDHVKHVAALEPKGCDTC